MLTKKYKHNMIKFSDTKTNTISILNLSFLISFIYVLCATLVCYMDGYNHYIPSSLSIFFYFVFLPAIVFPNLIIYAEGDGAASIQYMIICQTITLVGIWTLTYLIIRARRKKRERK